MISEPSVSIITVTYNSAATLKRTIESVLTQTVSPREYIIVDGCSTDDTLSIAESFRETFDSYLKELNEKIAEFGEDELRELEEAMEMLENMEMIDPHMTKEDLEELKRKHRASEQKAMMKADMDYLKGMIKLQNEGKGISAISSPSVSVPNLSMPAMMSMPSVSTPVSVSIDVQV